MVMLKWLINCNDFTPALLAHFDALYTFLQRHSLWREFWISLKEGILYTKHTDFPPSPLLSSTDSKDKSIDKEQQFLNKKAKQDVIRKCKCLEAFRIKKKNKAKKKTLEQIGRALQKAQISIKPIQETPIGTYWNLYI